jgi:hypothetical protein
MPNRMLFVVAYIRAIPYDTVASMHEVGVESFEKLKARGQHAALGQCGLLRILFSREVWKNVETIATWEK